MNLRIPARLVSLSAIACASAMFTPIAAAAELHVPRQYRTIQAAINAAVDGDTVLISPGTYYETISFNGKSIAVIGTDGPRATVIDAEGMNKTVVEIKNSRGPQTKLEGFTIQHGEGKGEGRGILIKSAVAQITNCVITDNHAVNLSGGGAFQSSSEATWTDCAFIGNSARQGGGIESAGPSKSLVAATFIRCTFEANKAIVSGLGNSNGGGAYVSNAAFYNCNFVGNSAVAAVFGTDGGGGAVDVLGDVSLTNCTFTENMGGAIRAVGTSAEVTIDGCTFNGNTGVWGGGAIVLWGTSAIVANSTFEFNSASHEGGAINANGYSDLMATGCLFEGNHAENGGAVVGLGNATVLESCVFHANTADKIVGAIGFSGGGIGVMKDCLITENTAGGICGGLGVLAKNVTVESTTICDNLSDNVLGKWMDAGGNEICEVPSLADLSGDLQVDGTDLGILLGAWGTSGPIGDLTNDSMVDSVDLYYLIQSWS
jgi:hypothetical protein